MGFEAPVLLTRDGEILVITVNRPHKANALNVPAFDHLSAALQHARASDAGAVVVTGAGTSVFCAGADVTELAAMDADGAAELVHRGQRTFDRLEELPLPTVAAINGAALGGGLELAMACDVRLATGEAWFAMPEITLANVPGWGGTQRLPRLVGLGRATQMILTGDRVDADTARAWGLVNWVVGDEPVVATAIDVARRMAARSGLAIECAKRALRAGQRYGVPAGLTAELEAVVACTGSSEQRTATNGFLTRPPGVPHD